jgi:hypothetical protein
LDNFREFRVRKERARGEGDKEQRKDREKRGEERV